MMTLFDDEYILKTYVEGEVREAAKEAAKQADVKRARETAYELLEEGFSPEKIAKILKVSVTQVNQWLSESAVITK